MRDRGSLVVIRSGGGRREPGVARGWGLQDRGLVGIFPPHMRFEKIWIEQCRATRAIKQRFGVKSALDYLVGEKLRTFAAAARQDVAFARELPRFLAAIFRVFNEYEIAGYVAMQKPTMRRQLRALLYFA